MHLQDQVRKTIRRYHMIEAGDHVILGLSGGADSVCLFRCLVGLQAEMGYSLSAVHVNHGIRGQEAGRDADFARTLCREWNIPCSVICVDVPAFAAKNHCSSEEAGRILRYQALEEVAAGWKTAGRCRIALAHHQDDQAETVLMNLCRGTGIRGLGGIPPVHGDRIRPLIEVRRQEILVCLEELGQGWREDATNQENDYTRNRLRHEILPRLEEQVNRRSVDHICGLAGQVRELDAWVEKEAEGWIDRYADVREDGCLLPRKALEPLPQALQIRILQRMLERTAGASRDITGRHLEGLIDLLRGPGGRHLDLPYGVWADQTREALCLRTGRKDRQNKVAESQVVVILPGMDQVISLHGRKWRIVTEIRSYDGEKIPQNRCTKWFDYDRIKWTLQLRNRQVKDRIALQGVGHKTVKRYMMDAGIPTWLRDEIPLLVDGEHDVLWIIGERMSSEYQVGEETRRVLVVSIQPE